MGGPGSPPMGRIHEKKGRLNEIAESSAVFSAFFPATLAERATRFSSIFSSSCSIAAKAARIASSKVLDSFLAVTVQRLGIVMSTRASALSAPFL